MGSIPDAFPISLRSWPTPNPGTKTDLSTLIQRINFERGGLREITEESLRTEIAAAAVAEKRPNTPVDDEDEEKVEEEKPDRSKELITARDEVIMQIEQAHQAVLFSLDFVSVLLSKHTPAQAGLTISPFLRDTVGMGTLGMDKLAVPQLTAAQKQEHKRIAKGWKTQDLAKAADSVLASAERLQKEMELEIKYWEQVVAVSEDGWPICRMPDEIHVLGVRFGFPESAASFQSRSLAALRRDTDGSAYLDQGTLRKLDPQSLRVRISTDGIETGCSSTPLAVPDHAPVEHVIKQARNILFAAELWRELTRETTSLRSFGVDMKNGMIFYTITPNRTMVIDVVPVGDTCTPPHRPDDELADGLSIALHLMLSFAHRLHRTQRTRPPPPLTGEGRTPPKFHLLRPIVTRFNNESTLSSMHAFFSSLDSILSSTSSTPLEPYTILRTAPKLTHSHIPTAESVIRALTDSLEAVTSFTMSSSTTLTIKSRTDMLPISSTTHHITLSENSPLKRIFPPPPVPPCEPMTLHGLKDWVLFAIGCDMAASFSSKEPMEDDWERKSSKDQKAVKGTDGWYPTSQPWILRKSFPDTGRSKQISFMMHNTPRQRGKKTDFGNCGEEGESELKVKVVWDWMGSARTGGDNWEVGCSKDTGEGVYVWREKALADRDVVRTMEEVVEEAGRG